MLNIQSRRRGSNGHPVAQQTTLSVSWLGRKFRALALHRGQVQGTWECPQPAEGTNTFGELLEQAVAQTHYTGTTVSLVLAHSRLAHQFVDAPPAKGPALRKVLERLAQEQARSLFPGPVAWSAEPAESVKGTARFLLSLFPKPLLDELCAGAQRAGLHLAAVLHPAAVLHSQLQELPSKDSQVVMLAGDTGGSTTVLVGRSDGRLVLVRSLAGTWCDNPAALATDLRRTMLFVNQQHGVNVEGLFLFGPDAAARAAELEEPVGLPTRPSPTAFTEDYWATQALRHLKGSSHNLVSREQQLAPQRRRLGLAVGVATALMVLGCLGFSAYFAQLGRTARRDLESVRTQTAALEARHRELQDLHADLARRRDFVDAVALHQPPPVALWVLGYLSTAAPPELLVTNLVVREEEAGWRLVIAGTAQPDDTNATPARFAQALASLTNELVTGPFRVQLDSPAPSPTAPPSGPGAAGALASWLSKLDTEKPTRPTAHRVFSLEGVIQP